MSILDKIKEFWKKLGEPDYDDKLSPEEEKKLKALNSNTKVTKKDKDIVPKVDTVKPIDINEIVPKPEKSKTDEGR